MIKEELIRDETLQMQARSNTIDNLKYGFDEAFLAKLIERMQDNQGIFEKILDDKEFGEVVRKWMLNKVYERLISQTGINNAALERRRKATSASWGHVTSDEPCIFRHPL